MEQFIFYEKLIKSKYTPAKFVFRVVWKILYLLMAVSFVLVLISPISLVKIWAFFLFVLQLLLNFSWSCVFFVQQNIKKSFLICVSLFLLVIVMTILFFRQSFWAGILQVPYCLWLMFATYLNYYILRENVKL